MQTSPAGRAAIARREGNVLKAYLDSVGELTIGVGHTSAAGSPKVVKGQTITAAESDAILARDLASVEASVSSLVKVPLNQNEFDALVSLVFNIGAGGFKGSSVLRNLNAGNRAGAADAMLAWNKGIVKGKKVALPGLTNRRQEERMQFLRLAAPAAPPAPVLPIPAPQSPAAPPAAPVREPQPLPRPSALPPAGSAAVGGVFFAIAAVIIGFWHHITNLFWSVF
jgi:lysozyme